MEKQIADFLNKWCDKYNIFKKCEKGFWTCFENYKLNDPEEFSENFPNADKDVGISLEKIAFCIEANRWVKPTIQIDYDIKVNGRQVGWYREIYFADGEFVDEFFVID